MNQYSSTLDMSERRTWRDFDGTEHVALVTIPLTVPFLVLGMFVEEAAQFAAVLLVVGLCAICSSKLIDLDSKIAVTMLIAFGCVPLGLFVWSIGVATDEDAGRGILFRVGMLTFPFGAAAAVTGYAMFVNKIKRPDHRSRIG